jgi:polyhydroxyalkanoate synthesis regulator phasin
VRNEDWTLRRDVDNAIAEIARLKQRCDDLEFDLQKLVESSTNRINALWQQIRLMRDEATF